MLPGDGDVLVVGKLVDLRFPEDTFNYPPSASRPVGGQDEIERRGSRFRKL